MSLKWILSSIVAFLITNVCIWNHVAFKNYTSERLHPGEEYAVGPRTYTLPELSTKGNTSKLTEVFQIKQQLLLRRVTTMFREQEVECWLSGDTLLGFQRHGTSIPWDDDIDVHTHYTNKELLFSKGFLDRVNGFGLQPMFLLGTSVNTANKISAGVRLRLTESATPVCDVFFTTQSNGLVSKVDGWNKSKVVLNKTETWDSELIFPLRSATMDGTDVLVPNQVIPTLHQQYGPNVLDAMVARSPWISHEYVFGGFLRPLWRPRPF